MADIEDRGLFRDFLSLYQMQVIENRMQRMESFETLSQEQQNQRQRP